MSEEPTEVFDTIEKAFLYLNNVLSVEVLDTEWVPHRQYAAKAVVKLPLIKRVKDMIRQYCREEQELLLSVNAITNHPFLYCQVVVTYSGGAIQINIGGGQETGHVEDLELQHLCGCTLAR